MGLGEKCGAGLWGAGSRGVENAGPGEKQEVWKARGLLENTGSCS